MIHGRWSIDVVVHLWLIILQLMVADL